jgi:pyruvate/2-oxoglutarate dehydrogenase complex dihydrolipoamide dehydrogenase (E3) component
MMTESFDLIVIGGGGAGREAATRAAVDHGASVAVIERERWGGSCANVACKPTKQYVVAAELLADLRIAGDLGIGVGTPSFDLARLVARKDWLVGTQETWRQRFVDAGFTTIDGAATIVDPQTVAVGDRLLTAERILIATGSRTALPPIDGIDDVPWIDNVGALELTELPESMLVMGAGAVGLEFAQAFARFGSRVTIVEGADRIAIRADADAAAEVQRALEDDGIGIVSGTFVTSVRRKGERIAATLSPRDGTREHEIVVGTLLVASGRTPNLDGLGLESLGMETGRGGIVVDETMRTSIAGIWAAGDVAEGIQLTPVGAYQAQVAVADMFNGSRLADYDLVPTAIFTDPELAQVGLTEADARMAGYEVEAVTHRAQDLLRPYYGIGRDATPRGLIKLVYERSSRRVLGLHAVVHGGADLVQGYAVAMRLDATVEDIALSHYVFPTNGEGVHYAAETALATTALTS